MLTSAQNGFDAQDGTVAFLAAAVGIEVYSIVDLLAKVDVSRTNEFVGSRWPDILFMFAVVAYTRVHGKENEADERAYSSRKRKRRSF